MREHTTIAWIGTVLATSLVLMGVLLVGGLRGAQGVAAAPSGLGSPPSPVALNTMITPTLTFTVAEPIVQGRPTLVTTTVIVSPTQTYRVNLDAGGTPVLSPVFTGTQTFPLTLTFRVAGTQVVTAELLQLPTDIYQPIIVTKTVTVIDPTRPTTLTVTAVPQQVATDGSGATITATVVNQLQEPISGTRVRFSSTLGTLAPGAEQPTNDAGVAVVRLTSATSSTAQITAIAIASPLVSDTTSVAFANPIPQNITIVQAAPTTPITGDGASPVDLSIRLLDQFGEPVPNTPVSFSTDLGTWGVAEPYAPETIALRQAAAVTTTRTTGEGFARARLTAPVNLSGSNQTATVQVQAGSATSTISVIFSSLPSTAVQLTAVPSPAAVCGSGTVQLSATLALTSGLHWRASQSTSLPLVAALCLPQRQPPPVPPPMGTGGLPCRSSSERAISAVRQPSQSPCRQGGSSSRCG